MTFTRHLISASTIGIALAFAAITSHAQSGSSTPITGVQTVTNFSGPATVTAVDPAARMVTLRLADGEIKTAKVSDKVQNLAQVKPGDEFVASFQERISFVLSGHDAVTPQSREQAVAVPGTQAAAATASQTILTWYVVSTDLERNTITLVDPKSGPVRTLDVETEQGRSQLPKVKPGDKLTAITTETMVVAVAPKS